MYPSDLFSLSLWNLWRNPDSHQSRRELYSSVSIEIKICWVILGPASQYSQRQNFARRFIWTARRPKLTLDVHFLIKSCSSISIVQMVHVRLQWMHNSAKAEFHINKQSLLCFIALNFETKSWQLCILFVSFKSAGRRPASRGGLSLYPLVNLANPQKKSQLN